nr:MAG TPA: Prolactin-releasing peptide [Caudoviricetes sp.]
MSRYLISLAYCHLLPYIWYVDIGVRPAGTEC